MVALQFNADMKLMFENCLDYNGPDSSKYISCCLAGVVAGYTLCIINKVSRGFQHEILHHPAVILECTSMFYQWCNFDNIILHEDHLNPTKLGCVSFFPFLNPTFIISP